MFIEAAAGPHRRTGLKTPPRVSKYLRYCLSKGVRKQSAQARRERPCKSRFGCPASPQRFGGGLCNARNTRFKYVIQILPFNSRDLISKKTEKLRRGPRAKIENNYIAERRRWNGGSGVNSTEAIFILRQGVRTKNPYSNSTLEKSKRAPRHGDATERHARH